MDEDPDRAASTFSHPWTRLESFSMSPLKVIPFCFNRAKKGYSLLSH